jgi:phosphatidylserine/phosphatidylglycerophosphate/cardiolipin synthase-like enzyme
VRRAVVPTLLLAFGLWACGGDDGSGDAIDAPTGDPDAAPACDYMSPRPLAPTLFVGPGTGSTSLENRVLAEIDGATVSIDLHMYNFTIDNFATRLIAAKNRGVAVRVILDPTQSGNTQTKSQLTGGGVMVKDAAGFPNAHAKYMVLDGDTAFILSGNFTITGMDDQRNYAAVDKDPDDVADLAAIFAADWTGQVPAIGCTRLVVSPADARTRVLAHIGNAATTLDAELYYIADTGVRAAIIAAKNRGVAVRVLLADTSEIPDNATTADMLLAAGVPVKTLRNPIVHAKVLIADGVGLVGSHNMSSTSLRDNREIGLFVREGTAMAPVTNQFTADWNAATTWQ